MAYLNGKRVVRSCQNCRLCVASPENEEQRKAWKFATKQYRLKNPILCRFHNDIQAPVKSGCRDFEPKTLRDLPEVDVPEERSYVIRHHETVEIVYHVTAPNRESAIEQVKDGIAEGEQVAVVSRQPVEMWSVVRCKEED